MVGSFELLLAVSLRSQTGDGPYHPGEKLQQQEAAKTAALKKKQILSLPTLDTQLKGREVDGNLHSRLKRLEEGSQALRFFSCANPLDYHRQPVLENLDPECRRKLASGPVKAV
jgi:hypothetical protein